MDRTYRLFVFSAGFLLFACAIDVIWNYEQRQNPDVTRAAGNPPASMIAPARTWQEIKRWTLIDGSYDLHGYSMWQMNVPAAGSRIRRHLHVTAVSADPARTEFVLMDATNGVRLQSGYPPILLAQQTLSAAGEFTMDVPTGQSWVGFIEIPPESLKLTSYSQLAILTYAIQQYQRASRPPIRLTARVENMLECNCTDAEAAEGRQKLGARD